jgi:peptide/nickel transport system permease protein
MPGLRRYVLRRLTTLVFVVWAILTLLFVVLKALPGDPTAMFVDSNFAPEMIERQRAAWGLDDPLPVQYLRYLGNMVTFQFGQSFFQAETVREIVLEKLANTWAMVLPALVLAFTLGAVAGAVLGWRRGSRGEGAAVATLLAMRSAPSFFVAILALMVFAYQLRWLPSGGMVSIDNEGEGFWAQVLTLDYLEHLILPALVLMSREITTPALLLRSTMLEVRNSDFVDILRAKGLPERRVIVHAARNAMLPLVTDVAVALALLFEGQVLLEIIFAWPGIGREMVNALAHLDYPIVQACFFLMALTILTLNLVADLLYGLIDPRVTYR